MHNPNIGYLILRIILAVVLLPHGVDKLVNGFGYIETLLAQNNLPTFFAYGVLLGEVVAPFMLLVGFYTRAAAGIVVVNMAMAIMLAHAGQVFSFAGGYWQIELQALILFAAASLCFTGPGSYVWRH